jgi:hypothetical protein
VSGPADTGTAQALASVAPIESNRRRTARLGIMIMDIIPS